MSTPAGFDTGGGVPDFIGGNNGGGDSQGGNQPQYSQYLERVPEAARKDVEPIFKEWDANYTRMTQQHAEQLKQYEPYAQLIEAVGSPETMQAAVEWAWRMQNQPDEVFKILAEHLNYDLEEDPDYSGGFQEQDPTDEKYQALEQGLSQLTELVQGNQEQQEQDQRAQQYLNYMEQVEQKNGPMDYDVVLAWAAESGDLDSAIQKYYETFAPVLKAQQQNGGQQNPQQFPFLNGGQPNQPPVPTPLGGGGGLPSNQQDLSKLSKEERVQLAANALRAGLAAQQQGG